MAGVAPFEDVRTAPAGVSLPLGGGLVVRDLRPEDDVLYPAFHAAVSAGDRRLRFFSAAPISPRLIHRLTHFDPAAAVARAAIGREDGQLYGVSRLHRIDADTGEFAVMVRSDVKGRGIGRLLLGEVIDRAPALGIRRVVGLVLRENAGMLALARDLGFAFAPEAGEPGVLRASLDLPLAARPLAA